MGLYELVGQVAGWAVTALLGTAVGALGSRLRAAKKRDLAMEKGMRAVMRAQLIEMHERYVADGLPCPVEVKEQATSVHDAYRALGGNGTGTHLYEEIMAAHVK